MKAEPRLGIVYPALPLWANEFRPAKRDSGVGALTESGFPLRIRNGRLERACHVERARPDFIGVPYECRFCTRRGDWAVRVETPLYDPHSVLGIGVLRLRSPTATSAQDDKRSAPARPGSPARAAFARDGVASRKRSGSEILCGRCALSENQVMLSVEAPDFSPTTRVTRKPGFSPGQTDLYHRG